MFSWFFVLLYMSSGLVHKINAQTPITAILSTYFIHEFLVNVKCRMDGSHMKPYICLSFDFLIQYSPNGTCLTSVSVQEYVTFLWLLWKSYILFPWLKACQYMEVGDYRRTGGLPPPKRATSPTWGTPPPCKQALILKLPDLTYGEWLIFLAW